MHLYSSSIIHSPAMEDKSHNQLPDRHDVEVVKLLKDLKVLLAARLGLGRERPAGPFRLLLKCTNSLEPPSLCWVLPPSS